MLRDKAIVDAYHLDEFKQYMEENNDGLWWDPGRVKVRFKSGIDREKLIGE